MSKTAWLNAGGRVASQGELVLVLGGVGAGKSSLLAALVAEAPALAGRAELRGVSVGYLPQARRTSSRGGPVNGG